MSSATSRSSTNDAKDKVWEIIALQTREFLSNLNLTEEIAKLLTTLSFEIKTEVRFIPNSERLIGSEPDVKASVRLKRNDNGVKPDKSDKADKPDDTGQVSRAAVSGRCYDFSRWAAVIWGLAGRCLLRRLRAAVRSPRDHAAAAQRYGRRPMPPSERLGRDPADQHRPDRRAHAVRRLEPDRELPRRRIARPRRASSA